MRVIKRDGRKQKFNIKKIQNAITAALEACNITDNDFVLRISTVIEGQLKETSTVEEIQDKIEIELMKSQYPNVAKAFITYREERTKERNRNSALNKQILNVLSGNNIVNSNANLDEKSFSGRKSESADILQKEIALNDIVRPEIAKAHREGRLYLHDLNSYAVGMHNCLFCDLSYILAHGFETRNGGVRPANSFSTACQLVAVIFQLQSQCQFGGIASAHIDYDLAPYVVKSFIKHFKDGMKYLYHDKKFNYNKINSIEYAKCKKYKKAYKYAMEQLEKEGLQSMQAMFHNLNTLESRAGSQLPFSSANCGRDVSPEGKLIQRWIFESSIAGIGKNHTTPIFPITIYQYKKGVNDKPGTPGYDLKKLAIKSLCKRIYPNIVNCDFSENIEDPNDHDTMMATMGCRTMLGYDRHGMGYKKTGRGNVSPVTVNLPMIGIKHGICLGKRKEADIKGFWKELDEVLALTETALLDRFWHICGQSVKSAPFMYINKAAADTDKAISNGIYETMKHGTNGIGYIGIAEMCQALFGKDHTDDKEVYDFALSVVEHIWKFAKEASERNNLNFSCYATPAESLCKTFAKQLKDTYGPIKNVCDREYLTNSHHCPVWKTVTIFKKLDLEAPFCKYATAGCITYVELEAKVMNNEKAVEDIIDYAMEKNIPYLALNFPIDTCTNCGYQSEIKEGFKCPKCSSDNILRLRRVTGYLSSDYHQFNDGKIAEVRDRVKHSEVPVCTIAE